MKKAVSIICLFLLAALTLCACGDKKGAQAASAVSHICDGKWNCEKIPAGMQFKTITLEISGDSFTYTLTGEKTATVVEGTAKLTGNTSMVLYMERQKQINNADKTVLQESTAQRSESESQPVYVRLNDDGTLSVTGNQMEMTFTRVS